MIPPLWAGGGTKPWGGGGLPSLGARNAQATEGSKFRIKRTKKEMNFLTLGAYEKPVDTPKSACLLAFFVLSVRLNAPKFLRARNAQETAAFRKLFRFSPKFILTPPLDKFVYLIIPKQKHFVKFYKKGLLFRLT